MKHPLDGSVEEHGVIEIGDLAVEPQVDAGDRRVLKMADLFTESSALGSLGDNSFQRVKGEGEDQEVKIAIPEHKTRRRWGIRSIIIVRLWVVGKIHLKC